MADVTFEKAIRDSMKMYWKKNDRHNKLGSFKDKKYNKSYFDSISPKKDKKNHDKEEY